MHIYIYIYIFIRIQFNSILFNSIHLRIHSHSHLHYIYITYRIALHHIFTIQEIIVHPFWVIPWLPWPSRSSSTGRSNIQEYRSEDKGPILSLQNLPGRMVFLVLGDSNDQYKRDTWALFLVNHVPLFYMISIYPLWIHYESILNPLLIHY